MEEQGKKTNMKRMEIKENRKRRNDEVEAAKEENGYRKHER